MPLMVTSYDYRLVALSVAISMLASYAALDLAGRATAARGRIRIAWLTGGAGAMGIGIWAMHYIGMLAFSLPVIIWYDWPTVLLSLLCAVLASAVALFVVSRPQMKLRHASLGSLVMGSGNAAMHYIGMAAMLLRATCTYSSVLVLASVVLAVVISLVALWFAFTFRDCDHQGRGWNSPATAEPGLSRAVNISHLGIVSLVVVTFFVLGMAVLTSVVDRRFSDQALELESSEQRCRELWNPPR